MSIKLTFSENCPKQLQELFPEWQCLVRSPLLRVVTAVSSCVHCSAFPDLGCHLSRRYETSSSGQPSEAFGIQFHLWILWINLCRSANLSLRCLPPSQDVSEPTPFLPVCITSCQNLTIYLRAQLPRPCSAVNPQNRFLLFDDILLLFFFHSFFVRSFDFAKSCLQAEGPFSSCPPHLCLDFSTNILRICELWIWELVGCHWACSSMCLPDCSVICLVGACSRAAGLCCPRTRRALLEDGWRVQHFPLVMLALI